MTIAPARRAGRGSRVREAAASLLAHINRPEPLERGGDWVIDCHASEGFLARLRALVS